MAEKVTIMKLKVDLECEKCFKKVKKLLSKEIRDQKFEEKQNIVIITVICCSPEKIRDKLCYKGGGSIKSIEIVELSKPKPPEPEKKKEVRFVEPEKKKEDEKPKPKPVEPEKKKDAEKPKPDTPKKDVDKLNEKPVEPKPVTNPAPVPNIFYPIPANPQVGMCCVPDYDGRPIGPYVNERRPIGPYVNEYDGYYGRPIYDSYGSGRPYYGSCCDKYFSEDNTQGCTIM
ncbi:hypothetical protein Lal_00038883 [Lupinus albus]|nr:hypothetical protein Lal_00038883 [Lupinus albus]